MSDYGYEDDRPDLSDAGDSFNRAFRNAAIRDPPLPSIDRPATPINDRLLEQEILSHHPGYRLQSRLLEEGLRGGDGRPHLLRQSPEDHARLQKGVLRGQQRLFEKRHELGETSVPSSPPYPIDLRALDYQDNIDANLVCPICQCPFQKPIQLECDHSFCQDCLEQSFDMNAERQRSRPCPTCRRPHSLIVERQAPRYVQRMLDEMVVRCPNSDAGCTKQLKRGEAHDHINYYCDYQDTPCTDSDCTFDIIRKDRVEECLHHKVVCESCGDPVMASDLEKHLADCLHYTTECPHCDDAVNRQGLADHINKVCPEAPTVCPGAQYGCTRSGKRSEVLAHANHCPIATMTPFLEKQKVEQEEHRAELEKLKRRNDIYEGSVKAMQTLIYDTPAGAAFTNPSQDASTLHPLDPSQSNADHEAAAPFDTPIQHLLSLHESLRDEFQRLEAALSDVDARATMAIVNESQRNKEDMAHTNAAINSMRSQLHWLVSKETYAMQRARAAGPAGGPGGGAPGAGPSNPAASLGPLRRMSGQETKL